MKYAVPFIFLLTSVAALSPAQKAMRKHQGMTSPRVTMKGTIKEILDGGRIIVLNDDSRWVIAPGDIEYTGGWLGPAPVFIVMDGGEQDDYPYTITNTWTNKSVHARKWNSNLNVDQKKQNTPKPTEN